ncbi:MAG: aminoacyl-tRNA hydrolase [Candidatus Paceibacterota bacterium]
MAWVVVGLGNPGEDYENTRHNTGRMALEFYAKKAGASAWKEDKKSQSLTTGVNAGKALLALVLPNTFMNKSGAAVARFVRSQRAAESLIVLYDDLDLPLGKIKLSFDRGSGGHKGIESITRAVKTKRFTRIRIGVSPETPGGKLKKPRGEDDVVKFILARFKAGEMDELKKIFKKVSEAIEAIVAEGPMIAMNQFN